MSAPTELAGSGRSWLVGLAGGVLVVVGDWLRLPAGPVALVGSALVVAIRVIALWRRWNAPTAPDTT